MGVNIDQMTNDGYFPTQIDHLHLLEGVSILAPTQPPECGQKNAVMTEKLPSHGYVVVNAAL